MRTMAGDRLRLQLEQNKCESVFLSLNRVNIRRSQSLFQRHAVSGVMWSLSMAQCIYLTEYVDELTAKAIQYCMKDDDDKPTLQPHKPSLASTYIHPNKDHIPLFSRYKK